MRKTLIAGNWKMNGSQAAIDQLLSSLKASLPERDNVDWAVFPPSTYIAQAQSMLEGSRIAWGGQNVCEHPEGAYTGEVSASMLVDFGCKYVIIGHSERRHIYNETNEQIAEKIVIAVEAGLTPVICVGETQAQFESEMTREVIRTQLDAVINHPEGKEAISRSVIAYEPVWAIGTGLTATPELAQDVHIRIRSYISENVGKKVADSMQILYGGSVKPDNATNLLAQPDIDGCLVGGASLDPTKFIGIGKCKN